MMQAGYLYFVIMLALVILWPIPRTKKKEVPEKPNLYPKNLPDMEVRMPRPWVYDRFGAVVYLDDRHPEFKAGVARADTTELSALPPGETFSVPFMLGFLNRVDGSGQFLYEYTAAEIQAEFAASAKRGTT